MVTFLRSFLVIFICSLILTVSEQLYRYYFSIPLFSFDKILESFFINGVFIILFRFSKLKLTRFLMLVFFFVASIVNNIHYSVYESWIVGLNIYLFFEEFTEVLHAGLPMLSSGGMIVCIIWGIFDFIVFLFSRYKNKRTSLISDFIFISLIVYIVIRSFSTSQGHGISPKNNYGKIKSAYFSVGYVLGRVLPYKLFDLSDVPNYYHDLPKQKQPKIDNIILIMGESVSASHMDIFGYDRVTTPFLNGFVENEYAVLKSGYSSGFMTSVALPSFFNAIPYPNGMEQIYSGRTNLLNLAKQQGYATFFHSAQAENEMNIINLIGSKYIDVLSYPTNHGYGFKENMPDDLLLDLFYDIDLEQGRNFVVLHHRGSHAPYGYLLREDQKVFGYSVLDEYDNTLYHMDQFIKNVFDYLQSRDNKNWLLIYTSDHGQYVTSKVANQGTDREDNYLVPFFLYTPVEDLAEEMRGLFNKCSKTQHQQLAVFIIEMMGYEMDAVDCNFAVVNKMITGDLGYLKINLLSDEKEWVIPEK